MIHPYHYLDLWKASDNSIEFESDYYIHKVTTGETLWTIAQNEYGDYYAWYILFWDNQHILEGNGGQIKPGMKLKIRNEF